MRTLTNSNLEHGGDKTMPLGELPVTMPRTAGRSVFGDGWGQRGAGKPWAKRNCSWAKAEQGQHMSTFSITV